MRMQENVIYKCQSTERLMFMKSWILFLCGWLDGWMDGREQCFSFFLFFFSSFNGNEHCSFGIRNLKIKTSNKQIHITNTNTGGPIHCYRCVRNSCMAEMYSSIIISSIFYAHSGPWLNSECVINIEQTRRHLYPVNTQHTIHWTIWIECDFVISFPVFFFPSILFRIRFLLLKTS